jgi:hypothetical protein
MTNDAFRPCSMGRLIALVGLIAVLGAAGNPPDVGSPRDVRAVRAVLSTYIHKGEYGVSIGPVRIVDRWAAADWINDGGGTAILQRGPQGWRLLTGGGGVVCPSSLVKYMPLRIARSLLGAEKVRQCARGLGR